MMSNGYRNAMWDEFVDWCWERHLDTDDVDFDAWCENRLDRAIDEAMEP